jgi:hypothetical protein
MSLHHGHLSGSAFIWFGKQISQASKPSFPERTTIADPSLRHRKSSRFDPAGAYPPDLFGMH